MVIKRFGINTLFRVLGAGIGLISLPLMVQVLGVENYGEWATLMSVAAWIILFDFGVSYSLKNTVSSSIAMGDMKMAKQEIIKTLELLFYLSFLLLFILIFFLFSNWYDNDLMHSGIILYLPIIIFFPLSIGGVILQGARYSHVHSGLSIIPNLFLCLLCFYYKFFSNQNADIRVFSLIYSLSLTFIWIFCFVYGLKLIGFDFKEFADYIRERKKVKYIKYGVAIRFFILQISSYILYSSGNIFIYSHFSAEDVAMYDIVNKVYLFGISLFNLVVSFFWAEVAYHCEQKNWFKIKKIYFLILFISFVFSMGSLFMMFFIPFIIDYLGSYTLNIASNLPFYLGLLVSLQAVAYAGALVLNAIEKISIQVFIAIISVILYYPLMKFFLNFGFNVNAIPLASLVLTFFSMVYCNAHAYIFIKRGCDAKSFN